MNPSSHCRQDVVAYATVSGGSCSCFYTLGIIGDYTGRTGSPNIAYRVFAQDGEIVQIQFIVEVPDLPGQAAGQGVGISIANEEPGQLPSPGIDCDDPGTSCTYEANFVYTAPGGVASWVATTEDEDHLGVFLFLTEFSEDGSVMAGRLQGTAVDRNMNGDISSLIEIDMPFRAGHFDGSWPLRGRLIVVVAAPCSRQRGAGERRPRYRRGALDAP